MMRRYPLYGLFFQIFIVRSNILEYSLYAQESQFSKINKICQNLVDRKFDRIQALYIIILMYTFITTNEATM